MNKLEKFLERRIGVRKHSNPEKILTAVVIGYNMIPNSDNFDLAVEFEGPDDNMGHNCQNGDYFFIRPVQKANGWFVNIDEIEFINEKPRIGKERHTTCSLKKE